MDDLKKNEDAENSNANEKASRNKAYPKGTFISIGVSLGLVFGLLFDNIAIGLCIGVALGVAIDSSMANKNKKK